MSQVVNTEKLKHNNLSAYGTIKHDKNQYYGSRVCEECGHQSGPLSIVDTVEAAGMCQ